MQNENQLNDKKAALISALLRYGITAAICLIIAITVARSGGMSQENTLAANMGCLSDGFFVAGVFVGGPGLLMWISSTGFFDLFGYAMRSVRRVLMPGKLDHLTFYDYKTSKLEKREKPVRFVAITGLACIALAGIFLVLYSLV